MHIKLKSRVHCVCSCSGGLLILGVFFTIISRDAICWGWTVIPDTHQFPLPAEPWKGHFLPHWSPGRYSSRSPQSEHQRWTALRSWTQNNGPTGKEVGQGKAASTAEDRLLSYTTLWANHPVFREAECLIYKFQTAMENRIVLVLLK